MPHRRLRGGLIAFAVLGWVLLAHAVATALALENNPESGPAWLVAIQTMVAVVLIAAGTLAGIRHGEED